MKDKLLIEAETYVTRHWYTGLELLVIQDMWEQGFYYPFISVEEVKDFWAKKGIE